MLFKDEAEKLVADILALVGGPLTAKADAIKLVETALRAAAERGRRDYHNQLADNMYPRRYPGGR